MSKELEEFLQPKMDETRIDEKQKIAVRMLEDNQPYETIRKYTDLTLDVIQSLGKPVTA